MNHSFSKKNNILKLVYKYLINQLFFLIYGKIKIGKVKLWEKKVHNKEYKLKNYNYKVYSINRSRIFTNNVENLTIIKNNYIIPQGSY